ncbi:hypothetical protein J2S00_001799 [Caldalkalibacillus uzonensis]|uniref:ATP-grasp domain-containing protein n=1 Tax=Caldalkalibacillus uzonensis TaxID=353224 RepID=A0ABU0CRG2_9BACI|nr:YheC/YheD family protein [Caldalkalibacillus uzonensis]MDQ0339013.1 hypothetical protein [Caldalkalibacillus uzonensis]
MKPERNKWERYKFMKTSEWLAPYLPETRKLNKNNFWAMINKFGTVYLKPIRGRRGEGIIKISLKEDNVFEMHHENKRKTIRSEKEAYSYIQKKMKSRSYIVQQPVRLTEINGRPIDFRVIVQRRNLDEPWTVTAKVVKVAGKGYIVTNHARSKGTILTVEEAIQKSPLKKLCQEELLFNIDRIALLASQELTRHYPYHRIYGYDIGVEPDGKIMIIEANSDPMFFHFRQLKDKTMYRRIMEYKRG